jgi:hypothetical protein
LPLAASFKSTGKYTLASVVSYQFEPVQGRPLAKKNGENLFVACSSFDNTLWSLSTLHCYSVTHKVHASSIMSANIIGVVAQNWCSIM